MEAKEERSTTEGPLHPVQYNMRSGTTDSGKEYKKKMLTLFALRCVLGDEENSWIATNAPHVGAFDDVVLHYGHITFLVKLKHKENAKPVLKEAFKEKKGDFSLIKYYEDVVSLKKSLDSVNDKPEFVRYLNAFDKLYFILFTNRDVNDYDFLEESNEQVLQFLNTSDKGKILKTVTHRLSSIVNLNNEDSCKDIYLFANQISVKHTDHQIQEEIKNIIRKFNLAPTNVKTVAKQFTNYVSDWAEGKYGGYYCLSRAEILSKLSEILLGQYQIDLSKETFDIGADTQIDIWSQLMNSNSITFVNYDQSVIHFLIKYISKTVFKYCGENVSSWLCNLSMSAQSAFYENHKTLISHMVKIVSNRGKITAQDIYKCLWLTSELPALLVIKNKQHYSDILKILKLCGYCYKVILINTSEEQIHLQNCEGTLKQFFSLEDLNETDRNDLLKLTVTLQGRSSAPLEHLVHQSFFHLIKCNDIINILLGNFNIGNDLEPLPDYFIERKVSKVLIKSEVLEQVKDDKFVIEGKYQMPRNQNFNIIRWEEFDFSSMEERRITRSDIDFAEKVKPDLEQRKHQTVHHLKVYDKNHFEWKASYGLTKNIRQFVTELENSFENNIFEKLSSRLTLFSGPPGMGKSILMNYIARNAPPTKWVLKIDSNKYMDYCRVHKVKILSMNFSQYVEHLYNFSVGQATTLTHKIFQKLQSSKDVIFLLDAFDEISILYKKEVTDIITSLYNEGFHICLTTRPHMESHLEEQFNTLSISLKPFSEEEQMHFFTNYFNSQNNDISLNLPQRYVTEFSKKLLYTAKKNLSSMDSSFTGIPLQCELLVKVFNENYRKFILSKGTFIFNENFDLLYLYRNFIDNRMDIFYKKYLRSLQKMLKLLNLQSLLALTIIFPLHKDIITYVEKQSKYHYGSESDDIQLLHEGGIVTVDKNSNISFVHRTFAEYLVADWLAENFDSPDQNLKDYIKILMNERFSQNYKFLFIMFDRIVAENCPLHLDIINGETSNLITNINLNPDYVSITDKCNRSLLHMTALYGIRYPLLYKHFSQTTESEYFLNLKTFNADGMLNVIDSIPDSKTACELDVFGYNPLDYALACFSITVASKLHSKLKVTHINASINLKYKRNYLGYCALQNYKKLFEILLVYFATKDFFLDQIHENESVQSYFDSIFADYDYEDHIKTYISKFKNQTIKKLVLLEGKKIFPRLANWNADLHISTIFRSNKDVWRLIQNGIDINKKDSDYNTPLHYAVLHKHTKIFNTLLLNGANVNQYNFENNISLHLAVIVHEFSSRNDRKIDWSTSRNRNFSTDEIVTELLCKGAKINLQNSEGNTALHLALLHKNEHLADLLLSESVNHILENKHGDTYLHLAVCQGFENIANKLLLFGIDSNKQNYNGNTPLHFAVANNKLNTVKLLIRRNSDPNIRNKNGENCLHLASYYGYTNIASEILSTIKDIDQQNNEGFTSLQLAVQQNKLDMVKLLIYRGADVNKQHAIGFNCLHFASYLGHRDIAFQVLPRIKHMNEQDNEGFTALQLAVEQNKLDVVKLLISKGADAEIQNTFGRNCLHSASYFGYTNITSALLPKTEDINQQDNEGFTSLQLAVQQNKLEIVKLLISKGGDPSIENYAGQDSFQLAHVRGYTRILSELCALPVATVTEKQGLTSLRLAVMENNVNIAKSLISKNLENPNIKDKHGRNCLHIASSLGYKDTVFNILPAIKNINQQDNDGFTSLQLAVQENKLDVVKLLISKKANANIPNKSGWNCLHTASYYGHMDIASEILPKIKNINQQNNEGFTSLQLAVQENKLDVIGLLIFKEADANIPNKFGWNCLHRASYKGHTEIASEILPKIKDINQQNHDGFTSLQLAVQENKLNVTKLLISSGANPNIQNKFGVNCLHLASFYGHTNIASEVLSKINDIDQQENEGFTSLRIALQENKLDVIKLLISSGANPNIQNKLGVNCLHVASYYGHSDVASEILSKINNINQQDNLGFTAFDYAVDKNKINMVKLLISGGANIMVEDKYDWNYIDLAEFFGYNQNAF